ncbi:MAG: peptidoglycan-binding domain-containing protein [Thainema sp.]
MHQKRYSTPTPVTAPASVSETRSESKTAPETAIAPLVGRLFLISSLIGGGFSLYPLLPAMAQTATQTMAQTADESADADDTAPAAAESSESDTTTESSESSENAPANDRRSPLSTARPNLRVGSEGQAVAELQALLKLLGYYTGAVDGLYSEETARAVSAFQTAAGLATDGVVGPATWGTLLPAAPVASPTAANQTPDSAAVTVTDFPRPVLTPGELASGASSTTETATDSATSNSTTNPAAPSTPAAATDSDPAPDTPAAESAETESTETASLPTDDSDPAAFPTLRLGASGPAVERLQERLQSLGHYQGAIDGIFGERTQEAVRAAQQSNQLSVDGVVGPATWEVLLDR